MQSPGGEIETNYNTLWEPQAAIIPSMREDNEWSILSGFIRHWTSFLKGIIPEADCEI